VLRVLRAGSGWVGVTGLVWDRQSARAYWSEAAEAAKSTAAAAPRPNATIPSTHRTAVRYSKQWEVTVRRLGRWIDFENDYKTLDPSFMESVWCVVKWGLGWLGCALI